MMQNKCYLQIDTFIIILNNEHVNLPFYYRKKWPVVLAQIKGIPINT